MNTYRGVQTSPKPNFYAPKSPRLWNRESQTAFPYKHKHTNLFPPKERPPAFRQLSNVEEEVPIFFASSDDEFEDFSRITARGSLEIPSTMSQLLVFPDTEERRSLSLNDSGAIWEEDMLGAVRADPDFVFAALKEYPAFTPPLACPPPFLFPASQSPTCCHAPVAKVTGLLEEVLTVMNTILKEQGRVEGESEVLMGLLELATIMQEEAEALVDLVDVVEVYVDEVANVSAKEGDDLLISQSPLHNRSSLNYREDSGISMGDETDSRSGTPENFGEAEGKHNGVRNAVIIQPASKPDVEVRRQWRRGKISKGEFRDSALDLVSPIARNRSPRWI